MKTEFRILWVDDHADLRLSIKDPLANWLEEKGIILKVFEYKNADGVVEAVKDVDPELIIIDYRLGKVNGDELILNIRSNEIYQDIIFYSEGVIPKDVRLKLNGVFFVQKKDAGTRIEEIIDWKLKRFSDPASVRGWIVADSIYLEEIVNEILLNCFIEREDNTFAQRIFGSKSPYQLGAKIFLLNGILSDQIDLLKDQSDLDKATKEKWDTCKSVLKKFDNEIIQIRNAIAHQQVEKLETGKIIKTLHRKPKEILLVEEEFIKIRKDINKHRENLEEILVLICG